jgi:two-component system CheB/CheR fusion protein
MPERDPRAGQQQPRTSPTSVLASPPAGSDIYIVGVGASAGGLAACRRFLSALPAAPDMAFIIVQHLDPTHDSMLAELLADTTAMPVVQAQQGAAVEAGHVYLIPPGQYLAVAQGRLQLSAPLARHGARLPFDFLLHSLAAEIGTYAACVILSGGGADGTSGALAVAAAGGCVIAQDPAEAGHRAMPESVIASGATNFVLPAAEIGAALINFAATRARLVLGTADIVALLKALTPHDFTLYKPGTLDRRIARRMALAGLAAPETGRYIARLKTDAAERQELVNDLLINVTSFFRDPKIFDLLAATTIPELVTAADGVIRVWVAGCSTGEETYSLAMLLLEQIEAQAGAAPRLQIFATDIDAQAVTLAREGVYPPAIEGQVSASRLARFIIREEHGYRVNPSLRACVIFAVQDVLADPPYSKLNLVSCRNLLIYLQPAAQEKIFSIFNFALRSGGFLLLGAAETIPAPDRRFTQISKPARLYRKLGNDAALPAASTARPGRLEAPAAPRLRPTDPGEICRKLVLENYAPAAVLINARHECIYRLGPTDAYLRNAAGPATHDLLAQLPAGLRARVREAVRQAASGAVQTVPGGRITREGNTKLFHLDIRKIPGEAEEKFLVCFLDDPAPRHHATAPETAGAAQVAELESELAAARNELEQSLQRLETAAEEHNAIQEEALSANEEFQSTNEELLTSKEELQSLNEELTALNGQLQETLERSRTTSTDLRNVLFSTDVPTLFLDEALNIRFFTPSSTQLFPLVAGDIGRKLEDFRSAAADPDLLADAGRVLATGAPWECEVNTANGSWYLRRIQAYRTYDSVVAGVVITFTDITERKAAATAIEAARLEAERANLAKSRFLAAASHDLRQPLQSMSLIAGMLAKTATDPASQKLVARLDNMMVSIATMLNAMLDINQIESGIVRPHIVSVAASDLLTRLREKFADQAAAQKIDLRVVQSSVTIATDPALLEQMLTNLLGNALKYTAAGRVLLGCRRQGKHLRFEVWDSGIGIAADQLEIIFDEYHQIDNAARDRSRGLGLGLSIVQRLGRLLGHKISVRSIPGRGSGFLVETPRSPAPSHATAPPPAPPRAAPAGAAILLVEDDPDIRELLQNFLTEEGFQVAAASSGSAARALMRGGAFLPALILADYNLPGRESGLELAQDMRAQLGRTVPVIIMTGDISTATLRLIAAANCVQVNKPTTLSGLLETISQLLAPAGAAPRLQGSPAIYIIDDDSAIRNEMRAIFELAGMQVATFANAEDFLRNLPLPATDCCALVDAAMPGMSGLSLLKRLAHEHIPAIMVTGLGDIATAVQAMKAGATDFLEKPVNAADLLACVQNVLAQNQTQTIGAEQKHHAARLIAGLTLRQREVMERVLRGQPNKNIAADLGISQRTVENHRASVMVKTGAKSIPALARLAVLAERAG